MEDMNVGELLKEQTRENTIREILLIIENTKDLEDAKEKIKALLN